MVALGGVTSQPMSLRPWTRMSQRFLYTADAALTSASALSRATIPALWTAMKMPKSMFDFIFSRFCTASLLPLTMPSLQPCMLKDFEKEWNSTEISFFVSNSKKLLALKPSSSERSQ